MNSPEQRIRTPEPRPRLGLFEPIAPPPPSGLRWMINGFPAIVIVWTPEQWAALRDRPTDAQYHPDGLWLALRME